MAAAAAVAAPAPSPSSAFPFAEVIARIPGYAQVLSDEEMMRRTTCFGDASTRVQELADAGFAHRTVKVKLSSLGASVSDAAGDADDCMWSCELPATALGVSPLLTEMLKVAEGMTSEGEVISVDLVNDNIRPVVLLWVCFFMKHFSKHPMSDIGMIMPWPSRVDDLVPKWFAAFVYAIPSWLLVDISIAAKDLQIASLTHLISMRISRYSMNKDPKVLEDLLGKLSDEAMAAALEHNKWAATAVSPEAEEAEPEVLIRRMLAFLSKSAVLSAEPGNVLRVLSTDCAPSLGALLEVGDSLVLQRRKETGGEGAQERKGGAEEEKGEEELFVVTVQSVGADGVTFSVEQDISSLVGAGDLNCVSREAFEFTDEEDRLLMEEEEGYCNFRATAAAEGVFTVTAGDLPAVGAKILCATETSEHTFEVATVNEEARTFTTTATELPAEVSDGAEMDCFFQEEEGEEGEEGAGADSEEVAEGRKRKVA